MRRPPIAMGGRRGHNARKTFGAPSMSQPWNFWFHVGSNTKSTWLHGDARGFRTRHHREHIDGDYRNPPPHGKYDEKLQRSMSLLKNPPVVLTREQCLVVCRTMAQALE